MAHLSGDIQISRKLPKASRKVGNDIFSSRKVTSGETKVNSRPPPHVWRREKKDTIHKWEKLYLNNKNKNRLFSYRYHSYKYGHAHKGNMRF